MLRAREARQRLAQWAQDWEQGREPAYAAAARDTEAEYISMLLDLDRMLTPRSGRPARRACGTLPPCSIPWRADERPQRAEEPSAMGVESPPAGYAGRPRDAQLEYKAILANASIGIAFTRDRKFTLCNPKFAEMFGWKAEELIGQAGEVVYPSRESYEAMGAIAVPVLVRGASSTSNGRCGARTARPSSRA